MNILTADLSQDIAELELYPLADLHIEDPLHDKQRAEQWRQEVLAASNRFIICNGDLVNAALRNSVTDTYNQTMSPNEAINAIADFLQPVSDRILAITEGNHERRFSKECGVNVMERVAKELGVYNQYSDSAFLLFISFGKSKGRQSRKTVYSVYCKHGSGGGKRPGSKANRLADMAEVVDADIYLVAHTHQPIAFRSLFYRCDYRNRKITPVEKVFVNTNAFLGYGGYAEEMGFPPATTRYPKIVFNGTEREVKVVV